MTRARIGGVGAADAVIVADTDTDSDTEQYKWNM